MISAIRRAIEHCRTHDTLAAIVKEKETKTQKDKKLTADVHESDGVDVTDLESRLKDAVVAAFGSARAAFDAQSKKGAVGKKEWKKLIKKAMPSLGQESLKLLRKRLPNRMTWNDFSTFFGDTQETGSSLDKGQAGRKEDRAEISGMAALPPEVLEVRHSSLMCVLSS